MAPWTRRLSLTVLQCVSLAQTRGERSRRNSCQAAFFLPCFSLLCRSSSQLILKGPTGRPSGLLAALTPTQHFLSLLSSRSPWPCPKVPSAAKAPPAPARAPVGARPGKPSPARSPPGKHCCGFLEERKVRRGGFRFVFTLSCSTSSPGHRSYVHGSGAGGPSAWRPPCSAPPFTPVLAPGPDSRARTLV